MAPKNYTEGRNNATDVLSDLCTRMQQAEGIMTDVQRGENVIKTIYPEYLGADDIEHLESSGSVKSPTPNQGRTLLEILEQNYPIQTGTRSLYQSILFPLHGKSVEYLAKLFPRRMAPAIMADVLAHNTLDLGSGWRLMMNQLSPGVIRSNLKQLKIKDQEGLKDYVKHTVAKQFNDSVEKFVEKTTEFTQRYQEGDNLENIGLQPSDWAQYAKTLRLAMQIIGGAFDDPDIYVQMGLEQFKLDEKPITEKHFKDQREREALARRVLNPVLRECVQSGNLLPIIGRQIMIERDGTEGKEMKSLYALLETKLEQITDQAERESDPVKKEIAQNVQIMISRVLEVLYLFEAQVLHDAKKNGIVAETAEEVLPTQTAEQTPPPAAPATATTAPEQPPAPTAAPTTGGPSGAAQSAMAYYLNAAGYTTSEPAPAQPAPEQPPAAPATGSGKTLQQKIDDNDTIIVQ